MANIDPTPSWAPIRQLETTDRNLAGPGGVLNTQPVSIAARLNLLRDNATALNNTVAGVSSRQDAADSNISSLESQVIDAASVASAAIPSPSPPINNTSVYFNGSEWTGYTVTPVSRTLMAATTQTAQRSAIQALGTPELIATTGWGGGSQEIIADCNTLSVSKIFRTTGATLNTPAGMPIDGVLLNIRNSTDQAIQIWSTVREIGVRNRPTLFVRGYYGNTQQWGPWRRMADDDAVVHNTGDEAISGVKTFASLAAATLNVSGTSAQKLASRRTLDLPITVSATAPASPVTNDIWLDISGSGVVSKKYNGTTWV